jgi:phage/plasmid-associated DNA primase
VFFKRKDKKKRLVWLYGARNTGKSSFIALMEEIFSTQ